MLYRIDYLTGAKQLCNKLVEVAGVLVSVGCETTLTKITYPISIAIDRISGRCGTRIVNSPFSN